MKKDRDNTNESGDLRRPGEQEREHRLAQLEQEQQRAKELASALQQERDMLQAIMESTHTQMAYLDPQFNFVRVNAAYALGSDHSKEELIGRNHFALFPNPENQAIFERVRETGQPVEFHAKPFEFADQPERGITYWDWTLVPINDGKGHVQGLLLSLLEVTEHQRAEQALKKALADSRQRQAEISALSAVSRAILGYREFEPTARFILDSCKHLTGATAGYIALLSTDGTDHDIVFLDSGGAPCTVDPTLPMPIRGLREQAYRTGKAVYENDFAGSEWTDLLPKGHVVLDNTLFAPLLIDGIAVGLLGLANKPGGFTENDVRTASTFSELAALALLNSRALESLRSSEERFRSVAQTANDAMITVDSHSRIVFWNQAAAAIFGHTHDEAIGKPLTLIVPQQLRAAHQKGIERVVATGESHIIGKTVEMVGLGKDGREFPVELSLSHWKTKEGTFFTGIVRDITERVRSEAARRESEAKWHSLVDNAPMFITIVDQSGIVEFINHTVPGTTVQDVIGNSVYDFVQPGYRDLARRKIEGVFRSGDTDYYVSAALGPDGTVAWYENHLGPITRDAQVIAVTIIATDITERRQAEETIRSLARFPSENRSPVMRVAQDGTILYANEASAPLLVLWACRVGQELPDTWCHTVDDAIHSGEGLTREVVCEDRIFSVDVTPVADAGYVNIYGRDITERKQAEETLRESEERFRIALKNSQIVVYNQDRDLRYTWFYNPQLGFTVKDILGKTDAELWLSEDSFRLDEIKHQVLESGIGVREMVRTTIDGEEHFSNLTVEPLRDARGDVVGITGASIDITERVQVAAALQELAHDLGERVKELNCLYGISRLVQRPDISLEEILEGTASLIPAAWQYPDTACARIVWRDQEFRTESFTKSAWKQSADIVVRGDRVGTLEVCYGLERPESDEGPFLKEERSLLNAISERLGRIIEQKQAEELLKEQNQFITTVFESLTHPFYVVDANDYTIKMANTAVRAGEWPAHVTCYALTHGRDTPCDGAEHLCPLEEVKRTGRPAMTEHIHVDREGNRSIHQVHGHPIFNDKGNVSQIIEYTLDVTEQVRAEEALRKAHDELEWRVQERTVELAVANEELQTAATQKADLYEAERRARHTAETLSAASLALTQTLDLDVVMDTLVDYLRQLVPYDSASFLLPQDETHLVVRAARGYERWMDPQEVLGLTIDAQASPHIDQLLTAQKSVLIPDTRERPEWKHFAGVPQVHSWLGVPLVAGAKVIGLCALDKVEPGFFTQRHIQSAEALVGQAAVAVQNAWLFEQVRAGRERLRALSHRLVEVQETERRYVARELHDEAGQALTSLMVGLRLLEREAEHPEGIVAGVAELKRTVDNVLENLHRLAADLRPASLDHLGLVAALRQYAEAVSDRHSLVVQFEAVGFDDRLPPDVEIALYRIVQEALTNVVRHARATRVDVLLERHGDKLITIVEDDGVGFDFVSAVQSGRLGLFGMRERTEMLGGTLVVESAATVGTTLRLEVPYADSDTDRR